MYFGNIVLLCVQIAIEVDLPDSTVVDHTNYALP